MISKRSSLPLSFPDWTAVLANDESLPAGLRAGYRRTLLAFQDFCRQKKFRITVQSARQFVELASLEKAPSPGRLQEWKDALNWYFRSGRQPEAVALKGVPPLARSDLGEVAWEQALIAYLRQRRRSWRTEQTYRGWLWRFARFLGRRAVGQATGADVRAFLTKLAVAERVGVATQRQALNSLVVYFRDVEGRDLGDFSDFARARKRVRVPVVLNRTECERLFEALTATPRLMAELMFGSGIRLTELLRLRVHPVR